MRRFLIFSTILMFIVGCTQKQLTILTGNKNGNYYKAAVELNDLLKAKSRYTLTIKETNGSFYNIGELGRGKAQLALSQFDVIMMYALLGKRDASKKNYEKLINNCFALAPMNYEDIHIIMRKGMGITDIKQLNGLRISAGPKNSGSWVSTYIIMKMINDYDIIGKENIVNLSYKDSIDKLAKGQLDIVIITSAQGMPFLKSLSKDYANKIEMLSLPPNYIIPKDLKLYYTIDKIPSKTYPWQNTSVYTLATPSYLLVYEGVSKSTVYGISKVIYSNSDYLKKQSNLWKYLSIAKAKEDIANRTPYHLGVLKYLKNK